MNQKGNKMENKYELELIKTIEKNKWMRWAHIDWLALSFSRATAYNHALDKLDTIKAAFEQNRSKATNYLLQKWIQSDNATLQIAAFKIIAEEEDHKRLNQTYVEQKNKNVDLSGMSTEEIKDLLKEDE
jgi:hypothetical protein